MKRFKNLYKDICSWDNLLLAAKLAQKGKRSQPNVAQFNFRLESELLQLEQELQNQSYIPGKYQSFYIYDPKERMISAAPYRDRVVHHALCNIIQPIFENTFIFDSYANRKGKGTHKAILRCQHFARKNKYALKADIRKYFPSIDHEILKQILRRKIACPKTLWLIDLIIDNSNPQEACLNYFAGDDLFTPVERRKGLPIGNLTSQYFANIYLNEFDHYVKEQLKEKHYLRYVDDFVLFHDDKQYLHEAKHQISDFLENYRLLLHPKKSHVTTTEGGITFLGQQVYPTHRLLRSENVRRCKKRMNKNIRLYQKHKLSPEDMEVRFNSWLGHAKQADTFRLRNKILQEVIGEGLNVAQTECFAWVLLEEALPLKCHRVFQTKANFH